MAQFAHARKTEKDGILFRIWSTNSGGYITDEMTEGQLREWTLEKAACTAIEQNLRTIGDCIQRAVKFGTSSTFDEARDLSAPWNKKEEPGP